MPPRWDHRRWGTLDDPCHKSQLSSLVGEFACTKQFQFDRLREATGDDGERAGKCSGKTEMGTAAHEAIARALRNEVQRAAILTGQCTVTVEQVKRVVLDEFRKSCGQREVVWYGKHEHDAVLDDVSAMVHGLLHDLSRHVVSIELIEAGFIAPLGDLWIEGHVDLIYHPTERPDALAFTDWKTGAQKPHQLVLDHGFESGFYSAALKQGLFLPLETLRAWRAAPDQAFLLPDDVALMTSARTERHAMHIALRGLARAELAGWKNSGAVRFDRFPEVIRLTHLADYVPYERKGSKPVERPEDVAHWSRVLGRAIHAGEKVPYERGQARGAAWLTVRRAASDIQRLERLLRGVVGWVRFGRFVEAVGEKCTRCPYKGPCLTSGYELRGDDAKAVGAALKQIDLSALSDLSTDD